MKCTIYRGTHEIGGSCIELKTNSTRILLDMGYPLVLNGRPIDETVIGQGKDNLLASGVLPDIDGLYRWDEPTFDAVILSHAHIDHYGLLSWLHPDIPMYLSRGTSAIIDLSQRFGICEQYAINKKLFAMYQPFSVGDILIKPYLMDHSAFDAAAFELKAGGKTVLYTGDFRGHGRKALCLSAFLRDAAKYADSLFIEGTMLGRQQELVKTEDELEDDLAAAWIDEGPVLFQCSSQNIDRLVTLFNASMRSNRLFIIDVYTANVLYELRQLGNKLPFPDPKYSRMKVFFPWRLTQKIFEQIGEQYARRFSQSHISKAQIQEAKDQICMMVRPSMLSDLIRMPSLRNGQFIYSMWHGYQGKPTQQKLSQFMRERNMAERQVHTSGHASMADLKRTIQALKPKSVVPIHGFHPKLFRDLYPSINIQQDGNEFVL